jgi:hypothetical protein
MHAVSRRITILKRRRGLDVFVKYLAYYTLVRYREHELILTLPSESAQASGMAAAASREYIHL